MNTHHYQAIVTAARTGEEIGRNRKRKTQAAARALAWGLGVIAAIACTIGYIAAAILR